jgi:hypothetical protein
MQGLWEHLLLGNAGKKLKWRDGDIMYNVAEGERDHKEKKG